jgi:hypothetical protein
MAWFSVLRRKQALGARERLAELGHLARDGFANTLKGVFEEHHILGLCPGERLVQAANRRRQIV